MIGEVRDRAGERAAGARRRQGRRRVRLLARRARGGRRDLRHGRRLHRGWARCSGCSCCCRSTSPSAATSSGCARSWRTTPSTRPRTSPHSEERLDAAETELEEVTGATAIAGRSPAAPLRAGSPRPPGSRTSARRSSGSRWSARRSRPTRAGAGSSTARPSRACWSRSARRRCCWAPPRSSSPRRCSPTTSGRSSASGRIIPGDVDVAVLNGTSINGLAGKVADDVEAAGYNVVAITNTAARVREDRGALRGRPEAGGAEGRRRPRGEGRSSRSIATCATAGRGTRDVVVIAGEDRV